MVNSNKSLNEKLDLILSNQEKILENEQKILGEEALIKDLEIQELENEKNFQKSEKDMLKEIDALEKNFQKSSSNIMKNISYRDAVKGFIGSFIAGMGHFAFAKGYEISLEIDILRATYLYIVAFFMIILMLYYTGFKNVKKHLVMKFMPLRVLILYSVSIVSILLINILFGKLYFPTTFTSVYTLVGASIILAVMGAGTADLIGREEEK